MYSPRASELTEDDLNEMATRLLRTLEEHVSALRARQIVLQVIQEQGGSISYIPSYDGVMQKLYRRHAQELLADGVEPREVMLRTNLSMRTIRRIEDELDNELNATD